MKASREGAANTRTALTTNHPRVNEGKSMAVANPTVTFKDIPGFPGYRVGDDGSVWSCRRRGGVNGRPGWLLDTSKWNQLAPIRHKSGHLHIKTPDGKGAFKWVFIHRLVLLAFVGPCPEGMECAHNDGNPTNNRLENLRWCSHADNMSDLKRHGTLRNGTKNYNAKLNDDLVRDIRDSHKLGATINAIATLHGVTPQAISSVVKRKTWRHVD